MIEQQVMGSVAIIYTVRQLLSVVAIKLYALLASAAALWQLTWVHRVFENWANVGLAGTWNFVTYATLHTHLPVQLALFVAVGILISFAVDMVRSGSFSRSYAS